MSIPPRIYPDIKSGDILVSQHNSGADGGWVVGRVLEPSEHDLGYPTVESWSPSGWLPFQPQLWEEGRFRSKEDAESVASWLREPFPMPPGVTVFARPEPDSPYLWRDESMGEEPEEGARRECAPDVYEALCCAVECPDLRQSVALERAAQALRLVGQAKMAAAAQAVATSVYRMIPTSMRARIDAAEKALAARATTAEEREILRLALFRA